MEKLTIEEIYCLSQYGMTIHQISMTNLTEFNQLYNDNSLQFNKWLDYAEKAFDRQEQLGIKIISCQDECYPPRLKAIGNDAPPLIHLLGNQSLLETDKTIAIIGARAADRQGLEAAFKVARKYAEEGNVIISGLAVGCDKAAHEGCLNVGGKTIAIVASGLDITHPKENRPLQDKIIESGGLILSEQILRTKANPTRLVSRNRLQAALSHAVILAQCPERSGSMHTMRFARKYRKQCFVVKFPKWTDANGGNRYLIENNLAQFLNI